MIVFYFSGTGNSRYVAQSLASKMKGECRNIEEAMEVSQEVKGHKTVAFCYPIYGSCVPKLMREFVKENASCFIGKKVVIFCTQLLFSGDGAYAMYKLLKEYTKSSVNVIYAEHFFMPNNLCNAVVFPVTSEKTNRKKIQRAERKIRSSCQNIRRGRRIRRGFHVFSHLLGMSQNMHWEEIEEKWKNSVKVDKDCIACGHCVKVCPVHNLQLKDGKIVANGQCMLCYRCVNSCPTRSITVLVPLKPKKQYHFPKLE